MMRSVWVIWWLLCSGFAVAQQPGLIQLDHNPALINRPSQKSSLKTKQYVLLGLPFIDDFSYGGVYPDPALWENDMAFINNNYPSHPPSLGVATLDALDAGGKIYHAEGKKPFYADTLTSRPIDLGVAGLQNVYLSFFYQPQGIGDAPEEGDSLILQFKLADSGEWRSVWNCPGTTVQPFKQVLIPVENDYCQAGFQFRFMNMVSLETSEEGKTSNADHWHIDYVRLFDGRNENDTAIHDVAMIAPVQTLIQGYQSIPWNQFQIAFASLIKPQIGMTYKNNDNVTLWVADRIFEFTDRYTSHKVQITSSGSEQIEAGDTITYHEDIRNPFTTPSVDSAYFELKSYFMTDATDKKENDTAVFYQLFKNFFARDDGIPETGYGIYGNNTQGTQVAVRYETYRPDSLRSIDVYFNPVANDATSAYVFQIAVWADDKGTPGKQIYLSQAEYSPENTGQFTRFVLGKPVYVTSNYWIGWVQVTSGFLNVGFDKNYNDKDNLKYNTSGSWQSNSIEGTLMMRPVFGKRQNIPSSVRVNERMPAVNVYPNPASQNLYLEMDTDNHLSEYNLEIFSHTGQLRYRSVLSATSVDVSGLESGVYVMRLTHRKSGHIYIQKILIHR